MASKKDTQFQELLSTTDFGSDLTRIATLLDGEKCAGLEIGEIAHRWIGDRRYHRLLNANVFSEQLKAHTRRELTGRQVRNYVHAYTCHNMLQTAGVDCPSLGVTHLSQIAEARCDSNEERIELAKRANDKKVTVRQIRAMAQRLHAERFQALRTFDVVSIDAKVKVMDALDLLREQGDHSIECAILDWQWSSQKWGRNLEYPDVYTPDDPAGHLCQSLELLKARLSPIGSAFLFYTPVGFLDSRIEETCRRIALKHAGKIIWQKTSGGFQDADTMLRVGHEEIHILCHQDYVPKAVNGGANSVTPRWAAPTSAVSGQQLQAVHRHQKPVPLMDLLIRISTVNGLVIDPFAGSGTAGIAAVRRGCPYLGSELVPEIAEIANRRIALAHGENEEVVEAVNFFMSTATNEQRSIITHRLANCGLRCVQQVLLNIAA